MMISTSFAASQTSFGGGAVLIPLTESGELDNSRAIFIGGAEDPSGGHETPQVVKRAGKGK